MEAPKEVTGESESQGESDEGDRQIGAQRKKMFINKRADTVVGGDDSKSRGQK